MMDEKETGLFSAKAAMCALLQSSARLESDVVLSFLW